jgi:hypothetical protein
VFPYCSGELQRRIIARNRDCAADPGLSASPLDALPQFATDAELTLRGGICRRDAETLGITERTVQRDWEKARLILAEALR